MIVLVRHGQTRGNVERVLQVPETPLSEEGLAQAARLGERLASLDVGRILASDYARAHTTAEAVRKTTGAPLELDPGLRERHFGDLRGMPYADLPEDPFGPDYVPPGGESWQDLHERVDAVWERIVAARAVTEGALVVVTHGLVCHSLASRILTLDPEGAPPRGFGNTSVTLIDPAPPWQVRLLACTAHLAEDGPGSGGLLQA